MTSDVCSCCDETQARTVAYGPVEIGLGSDGWTVVTPCQCGGVISLWIDAGSGWMTHAGPLVIMESAETELDVVIDHYLHAPIDPDGGVDVWDGKTRVTLPELMRQHRTGDSRTALETCDAVRPVDNFPAGSDEVALIREQVGRHPEILRQRLNRVVPPVDGTVEGDLH